MDDLERLLPTDLCGAAVRFGNELLLPLDDAKAAVRIASENYIAVLGVEVFMILDNGIGVVTYSGYEFSLPESWQKFVLLNNDAALAFIAGNSFSEGFGYVLTSTSEDEYQHLPR